MAYEIEKLIASKMIARKNPVAEQVGPAYMPRHRDFTRQDITDHLSGAKTYGHYLVNEESKCKMFCFDIDVKAGEGYWPTVGGDWYPPAIERMAGKEAADKADHTFSRSFQKVNLRKAWLDRSFPGRWFPKLQLRTLAGKLMRHIWEDLEIPCAVASSGSKGLHVYGFTGLVNAADAREGAQVVLDLVGGWRLYKGNSMYESTPLALYDASDGYPQFDIEIYPKQASLEPGQLGNLLRLPLGKNKKAPKNPTWFLDPRAPLGQWVELDPILALSGLNPWKD